MMEVAGACESLTSPLVGWSLRPEWLQGARVNEGAPFFEAAAPSIDWEVPREARIRAREKCAGTTVKRITRLEGRCNALVEGSVARERRRTAVPWWRAARGSLRAGCASSWATWAGLGRSISGSRGRFHERWKRSV
jgi:hypothetical protein